MGCEAKGNGVKKVKNYYEMKLRENRELIDELKVEITVLSNMLWEMKQELDKKKSRFDEPWGDYK